MNRRRSRQRVRWLTRMALLTAAAVVLGYVERLIPMPGSIPGIKLGLANTVLLYCSMGTEPDTEAVLEELLARGKRVALPRCLPGRSMETRLYVPGLPLLRHRYGMLEPGADHPLVETAQIDLALVPALAYDIRCMRMGRGGGYYDRYLADFPSVTVGLCRDALLQKKIPAEPHDRPVGLVVTETRLFRL